MKREKLVVLSILLTGLSLQQAEAGWGDWLKDKANAVKNTAVAVKNKLFGTSPVAENNEDFAPEPKESAKNAEEYFAPEPEEWVPPEIGWIPKESFAMEPKKSAKNAEEYFETEPYWIPKKSFAPEPEEWVPPEIYWIPKESFATEPK